MIQRGSSKGASEQRDAMSLRSMMVAEDLLQELRMENPQWLVCSTVCGSHGVLAASQEPRRGARGHS